MLQVVEPGRDFEHRRARPGLCVCDPHAINGFAEANMGRHADTSDLERQLTSGGEGTACVPRQCLREEYAHSEARLSGWSTLTKARATLVLPRAATLNHAFTLGGTS